MLGTESPEYPELRSIMAQAEALPEPAEDGIMEWITYKYNGSKGFARQQEQEKLQGKV